MFENSLKGKWALVLGSSSGFGEACSLELAHRGMNIFGVHLDRRGTMAKVESIIEEIKSTGSEVSFYNVNVADPEKRQEVISDIKKTLGENGSSLKVMIHSVAFGTLKRYVSDERRDVLNSRNIDMTLDVMAHSIVYWAQDLVMEDIMGRGGRIFAMTSSGSHRVWPTYGAVSAAKASIEAHIRQLAVELAPSGITANSIMAGVTDTPALRKIPGNEKLIDHALGANPSGRLTTPEDVAKAVALLSLDEASWITGNVIGVDGGEDLV
ncbi:MAG: SDR family oxidoreductase [Candidatus Dadabacteria bacterium]|nr:SDR family oxidoreductase [Candidatus Dadabacteria bacterium]MCY4262992.1 SDR family oxidoreductase [Candidatus Dadabacteria bacterium]